MYTLGDIPRKGAERFGDKEAVVYEGTRLSYREFNDRINRLGHAMKGLGFKEGDRLTVLAENSHKYLEVYFAASKMGMSVTPINFRLSDAEIVHIVNDSEATLYFAGDTYEERSRALGKDMRNIRTWIAMDNPSEGFLSYEERIKEASDQEPQTELDENEMVILMYTGGTTGLPKGVMLSHRNIMTATLAMNLIMGITPDDSTCYVLPLFHIALWPALCLLLAGGKVAINRRPDLGEILRVIQDEKCTHINLVPTVYGWLLQDPGLDQYDLTSLRAMTYAGSPFPPEVLKQCIQRFGNIFAQGYGLTEAAPLVSYLRPEEHFLEGPKAALLKSAGKPGPCVEVKIVDEDDNPVKPGEVGEICARGRNIMMGYWKNPELTAKALRNGWLHTGDMGTLDQDGFIFLADRKADMIVTGGENVYPKETEEVLYEHPSVMECAVVSAPDERWGERVQAVVVLKEGAGATGEELIQHCKSRLAGYKCPKSVEFRDVLPKTPIGKIIRKDVKKHFWKGRERTIG